MSTGLQQKLYSYELPPPAGNWDKIAVALDESCLENHFPGKLSSATATPPAQVWAAITEELDAVTEQYPATLYNMEAIPPATAWEAIAASLTEDATPVAKKGRIVSPFFRYAAAAAIIGFIAFGAVRILNSDSLSSVDQPTAKMPAISPATNDDRRDTPSIVSPAIPDEQLTATQQNSRDEQALENSKHTYASLGQSDELRIQKVSDDYFRHSADVINAADSFNPIATYQDLECNEVVAPSFASGNNSIDMANRYVMLMTPDGRILRISKKLGDLVCCVSGEEVDEACEDQLKKWRKKLADSPVTPAPGNFMDILDLLHTFKDSRL